MNNANKTKTIAVCAVMVSLSLILSFVPIVRLPNGGSITLASLCPIIVFSIENRLKWGITSGVIFGVINLILCFHVPPAKTFVSFAAVVLLDYIIASGVVGLSGVIFRKTNKLSLSVFYVMFIRYICFVLSGVLIWNEYIPKETPVLVYSLIYNAIYIVPEAIITYFACKVILNILDRTKVI